MGAIKKRAPREKNIISRQGTAYPDDSDLKPPVFSFEYLQQGWCVQNCQQDERAKMLDRLRLLSQLSWREIRQQDRHAYGTETLSRNSIRAGLPQFITADVRLLAFRAYDKVAMVGYRRERVFHIVWVDREFKLYQH